MRAEAKRKALRGLPARLTAVVKGSGAYYETDPSTYPIYCHSFVLLYRSMLPRGSKEQQTMPRNNSTSNLRTWPLCTACHGFSSYTLTRLVANCASIRVDAALPLHSASCRDHVIVVCAPRARASTSMVNAIKVFQKTAPNGKVTCYLSRRDFVENDDHIEPVDGVIVVDDQYLNGRSVFVQVWVTYRYGLEKDEILGLFFSQETELVKKKVHPSTEPCKPNEIQDRLMAKLGGNAHPFTVSLPANAPNSVTLEPSEGGSGKPIGVTYDLRMYVANDAEEEAHKRNTVSFTVRKIQFVNLKTRKRLNEIVLRKTYLLPPGKLDLEVSLSKDMYYHGEQIDGTFSINNASKKTVKYVKCEVIQHIECTKNNQFFDITVASIEYREGLPVTPGCDLEKPFHLLPVASTTKSRFDTALDGRFRDEDVNLCSSTLTSPEHDLNDAMGIVVSYSVQVTLKCGAIGGTLTADVPFRLVHSPCPEERKRLKKTHSVDSCSEDGIVFEDFTRLRRGQSITDST